jgi:hypothetical protein
VDRAARDTRRGQRGTLTPTACAAAFPASSRQVMPIE